MSTAILDHRRNPTVSQVRVGPPEPVLAANIATATSTTPMQDRGSHCRRRAELDVSVLGKPSLVFALVHSAVAPSPFGVGSPLKQLDCTEATREGTIEGVVLNCVAAAE
jgi:hypothetical protein